MGSDQNQLHIPVIDFSSLDPSNPAGHGWDAVRAQVKEALLSYGYFEAIFDRVTVELREALFGRAMPELFSLPLETKKKNASRKGSKGYISQIPTMAYEHLRVGEASLEDVEEFTNLMWPGGNPDFCNTVWLFAKQMQDLARMIHRMILESFGLGKYYDSHIQSIATVLRLSGYGVPLDQETKIALDAHVDPGMVSIICQHQVDGLEVQASDGEWIHVTPLPNSFTVMTGEAISVWTNGRLQPPCHRVKIIGNDKRHSALIFTRPRCMLEPQEELADEEHPLLYNHFDFEEYINFRFSEEGKKHKDTLKAYCGVRTEVKA